MTYKDLKEIIDQMTPDQLDKEAMVIDSEECCQERTPFSVRFLCRSGSEEANKLMPEGIKLIDKYRLIDKLKYESSFLSMDYIMDLVQGMINDPDQCYILF